VKTDIIEIEAEYTAASNPAAAALPPLTYHAHQAALHALMNINAEIMTCEKACKGMDAYIQSGDFSMSSPRARERLKVRTEKAFEARRKWHEKFDGRSVLPKP